MKRRTTTTIATDENESQEIQQLANPGCKEGEGKGQKGRRERGRGKRREEKSRESPKMWRHGKMRLCPSISYHPVKAAASLFIGHCGKEKTATKETLRQPTSGESKPNTTRIKKWRHR